MYTHVVIITLLVLATAACGEGSSVSDGPANNGASTSCEWGGTVIGGGWATGTYLTREVLELRALRRDIVARATLVKDEVKVVDAEVASRLGNSIDVDTHGAWSYYSDYKYTLLHELELRVREYLKGQGPDRITAIVAGQRVSNSEAEIECAKRAYEGELNFEEKSEGIFFLEVTDVPDRYYLGLSYSITGKDPFSWSPFMPGTDGEFYLRERGEWVGVDEIRGRVSDAIQEYSRYEDADWQQCVMGKYLAREWLRGQYRGLGISLEYLPKQVFSFSVEDVPVTAGTTIWEFPDTYLTGLSPRLEGESASRFEITFHQDHQFGFDRYGHFFRWEGTSVMGLNAVLSAKWTAAAEDTVAERTSRQPGYTLTVTEDLPQGLYRFFLSWRDREARDCGQGQGGTEYLVVVTEPGGPSEPPPAPTTELRLYDESNSIEVSWENLLGVSKYVLNGTRRNVRYDYFKPIVEIQAPSEDATEVTWSIDLSTLPCDMQYDYNVQARGDGKTYIDDWGQPSEYVGLIVTPENMSCKANHRRIDIYSGVLKPGR